MHVNLACFGEVRIRPLSIGVIVTASVNRWCMHVNQANVGKLEVHCLKTLLFQLVFE